MLQPQTKKKGKKGTWLFPFLTEILIVLPGQRQLFSKPKSRYTKIATSQIRWRNQLTRIKMHEKSRFSLNFCFWCNTRFSIESHIFIRIPSHLWWFLSNREKNDDQNSYGTTSHQIPISYWIWSQSVLLETLQNKWQKNFNHSNILKCFSQELSIGMSLNLKFEILQLFFYMHIPPNFRSIGWLVYSFSSLQLRIYNHKKCP